MAKSTIFDDIIFWITLTCFGLIPFFFLPITPNYYETNKWLLLLVAALIVLFTRAVSSITYNEPIQLYHRLEALSFGLIAFAGFISVIVSSTNKLEALTTPLGPLTFTALAIILAFTRPLTTTQKTHIHWIIYGSAALLGLIAVYQWLGMGTVMFEGVPFLADHLWTPTGTTTTTLAFFAITLILGIEDLVSQRKHSENQSDMAFTILCILVIATASAVTLWQVLPQIPTTMLPMSVGWTVLLTAYKQIKWALTGVGAENFITAYTRGKPEFISATPLWNIQFTVNANFFLHIATIYGAIGAASSLFLAYLLSTTKTYKVGYGACLTALAGLLLVPPSVTLCVIVAAILILTHDHAPESEYVVRRTPKSISAVTGICFITIAIGLSYGLLRFYNGELWYNRARASASQSEGTNTYTATEQAIKANPFNVSYRILYSQTSLAIANSIAGKMTQTSQGQDQQLIGKLIEQSVTQGKLAVSLNNESALAWENLGAIYQAIIAIAPGSDAWAQTAYTKALSLDPVNPALTLALGTVYTGEKKYDDAIRMFLRATTLRPTYANAYYNLANAYRKEGNIEGARNALVKTMDLVPPASVDYVNAQNELNSLTPIPEP